MKRKLAGVAVTLALLLGIATVADAAVRAGDYRGKTEQEARISFRVTNAKAVTRFFWEGVVLECSDGRNRQLEGFRLSRSARIREGRFELGTGGEGFEMAAVGRFRRRGRVTGALQVQVRADESGQIDPNGSITCDSEIVEWSARRR